MLAVMVLVAVLCGQIPLLTGVFISPWLGVAASFAALWIWSRFGPSPTRGYASGIVCLVGYAGLAGSLVACVVLGFRDLLT